jgi:hypothetical protein
MPETMSRFTKEMDYLPIVLAKISLQMFQKKIVFAISLTSIFLPE